MSDVIPVGSSEIHQELLQAIEKVAATEAEILINGPTGVGKELYARLIHSLSRRSERPFVPVNCGALSDGLLENELFGHVRGAFTGAQPISEGLVHAAEGGTLFLDEVDSIAMGCQVRLLRFLQEREFRRLGETRLRRANVRVLAATNCDLRAAVNEGWFRNDLYFRLHVVPIDVPPLRERIEDLEELVSIFADHYAKTYELRPIRLSEPALECMRSYSWPGNIRELENCICYLTCMQPKGPVLPGELPLLIDAENDGIADLDPGSRTLGTMNTTFQAAKQDTIVNFEREYLETALRRSGGNISQAARASGKARRAFFELMRKHAIDATEFKV